MIAQDRSEEQTIEAYGLSEATYSLGYQLRLQHATFLQSSIDWLTQRCTEMLPIEMPQILSLGCGNGDFDIEFLKNCQRTKPNLHFTGLDYNLTDLAEFRRKLSLSNEETQSRISLEYKKFDHTTRLDQHFDLIVMVHFLHSFDNVLPVIRNALKHLNPGGRLLIVQQNEQGIYEIKSKFIDLLPNQKFHSSDKIKHSLQANGVKFTAQTIDTYFDVSSLQDMSLDSLLLMSFCFNNDLSRVNTQQQNEIREAFLSYAQKQNNGSLTIYEPMEAIVCQA